ncbi:MAG: hypothetical protein ABI999_11830 [Acidobacteriota bacterium]
MENVSSGWKRFTPGYRGPRKSYMHVSINKRGKIQLNTFLMEKLDFPEAVVLFYDEERRRIGMKPAECTDEDAIDVNLRRDRRYGELYALSFLRYNNIQVTNTIATNYIEITPDGMMVIDLIHSREVCRKNDERPERSQ